MARRALIGTAAGPAIGGLLTQAFDWRAIFAVQAPLALARGRRVGGAARPPGSRRAGGRAGAWQRAAAGAAPAVIRPRRAPPRRRRTPASPPPRPAGRDLAALALTAAAFTAVLFLLVIELVAGFAISPRRAAARRERAPGRGARRRGDPRRAAGRGRSAGALLFAGGAGALAFLPAPGIGWTLVPQLLAGAGMGLALPALSHRARRR